MTAEKQQKETKDQQGRRLNIQPTTTWKHYCFIKWQEK